MSPRDSPRHSHSAASLVLCDLALPFVYKHLLLPFLSGFIAVGTEYFRRRFLFRPRPRIQSCS